MLYCVTVEQLSYEPNLMAYSHEPPKNSVIKRPKNQSGVDGFFRVSPASPSAFFPFNNHATSMSIDSQILFKLEYIRANHVSLHIWRGLERPL